jgi:flagellar biosynthesis GTPase FlhF
VNRILTYRPGEIRNLQDQALADRLTDFINTQASFDKNFGEPLWAAQNAKNRILNATEQKARKTVSAIGYIIYLCIGLPALIILIATFSFSRILQWIDIAICCGVVLLILYVLLKNGVVIRPKRWIDAIYKKEVKKRDAEIRSCDLAITAAKNKFDEINMRPEMRILNEFFAHEGSDLDLDGLKELRQIVRQGYARDFAQAKNVLAQRKHNQKVEDIAEQRREQDLEHQRAMEREAAQQRAAQQAHYRQQDQHNREQARANQQTNREVEKAAKAAYDYYHRY